MSDDASQDITPEFIDAEELLDFHALTLSNQAPPDELHLLPLSERPFFPAQAQPLLMNEKPWRATVEAIGETEHHMVGMVMIRPDDTDRMAGPQDFHNVGTMVRMHNPTGEDGKIQFIAEGIRRFRIKDWLSRTPPYRVRVEYVEEPLGGEENQVKAYSVAIINTIKDLLPLNPLYREEVQYFVQRINPNEPSKLTDFAASLTTAKRDELQTVLETFPLLDRMEKVLVLLNKELELAKLQSNIRSQVEDKVDAQQRKFFLREQLKTIQKELGLSKDDREADLDRFADRLKKLTIPATVQERIDEEFDKLRILEKGSSEYGVSRNYLDWITALPWGVHSKDKLNLSKARKVLDRDHDGLEDVKDRIIEFLAVGALKGEVGGSIILLVGPPGVGKTSIGRSVADALGRKFYRFSVGGMRDEAEIKGHRRTYVGAMPGKIVHALKEVQTSNPVIMLDEIDKIGASYQGDPASALLEVLDPEQNSDFQDHYLDVRFDLSKALFVCTANQLDSIPGPLLDRMEIIRLAGYITSEKLAIARHHLWPRLLERSGLEARQVKLTDAALCAIIEGYAREAGVRHLEKLLARILRKAAVKVLTARGKNKGKTITVSAKNLTEFLGQPYFQKSKPLRGTGVVTGLAWTAMGGATLDIEATVVHSRNSGFKLTGKLGEVMQESAQIAYSYLSAHLVEYGAPADFLDSRFLHLHVPEGATPKDGPSAGVTMTTALLSLARGKAIKRPLAMTGEITLTGHVLPVGGIKEKVIAARRTGVMELILPDANRRDFEELPEHIREGIQAHFAKHYRDVYQVVFENN
ncbi:MAG: endopeptidase La [Gammaproteobacteria bacterium]|nr:endopeptidase La [Gammaproteobacteria bacterium]MCP5136960.1 endopeptidase La [Gammaproteobacteria bacterium]